MHGLLVLLALGVMDLAQARAELEAGRPDRAVQLLAGLEESVERDLLQVRSELAAGRYRDALSSAESAGRRWEEEHPAQAVELRFYGPRRGFGSVPRRRPPTTWTPR